MARGDIICVSPTDGTVLTELPGGPTSVPSVRDGALTAGVRTSAHETAVRSEKLSESNLYWVSEPMCDLIAEAMRSLPLDCGLPVDSIPCPAGFVVFERHFAGTDAFDLGHEEPVVVSALQWYPVVRTLNDYVGPWPEIDIDLYSYVGKPFNRLAYIGGTTWPLKVPLGRVSDKNTDAERRSQIEDRRLFAALISMLASPGVASVTTANHSRQARRKAERAGRPLDAVRVIRLKREESGGAGQGSDYHHRWIVSGHWRSQPYGPGRTLRRQTWIAPHIKGPEGAPLLTGEKVRVL